MIKKFISSIIIIALVFVSSGFTNIKIAMAASLTSMSDTLSNSTASTAANHTIVFTTPTGIAASATLILTFDNSTNTGSVAFGDIDLLDDGVDVTLAATPSGTTWGVVKTSATVITFTNGSAAVAAGSVITIKIGTNATGGTNQITNGAAGTTTLTFSGTFGDTGVLSMAIISNSVVAVSAEVLSSLSFTVSDNTIYYGRLQTGSACFAQGTDPGAVTCPTTSETEAFNLTAGTNAASGYTITVQGATLTSGANTITALGSNTASSPGTEQFGIRFNASGGSGTVTAPYATAGYAYTATSSTAAQVASYSGPSATTTYSARYLANIAALTEAGTYTTSHTYVATGNF